MTVTLISGDSSTDLVNSVQHRLDVDDTIAQLEPNNAPYQAVLRRLRKKDAVATTIQWLEVENYPRFDTLTASSLGSSAATALSCANPSYFRVGDGVRITETGEFVQVTGVSASSIGVTRGIGGKAIASATSAAGLYIVNNANAEGASLRTIKSVKITNASNYTQIIREPFGVTETERAVLHYDSANATEYDRLMKAAGMKHERELEFTALFGAKKEDTTTAGAPVRFAGGLYEYISTNVTAVGGALTRSVFETFIRSGFRYGSDRKLLLASPLVNAAIDGWAWNSSATGNGSSFVQQGTGTPITSLGVNVKTYYSSQGIVDIMMVRHWNDDASLKGYAFLVDLDAVWYRPLRTRDTHVKENVQANDADKKEGEYITECSFEVQHERRHALLTGVTS